MEKLLKNLTHQYYKIDNDKYNIDNDKYNINSHHSSNLMKLDWYVIYFYDYIKTKTRR